VFEGITGAVGGRSESIRPFLPTVFDHSIPVLHHREQCFDFLYRLGDEESSAIGLVLWIDKLRGSISQDLYDPKARQWRERL